MVKCRARGRARVPLIIFGVISDPISVFGVVPDPEKISSSTQKKFLKKLLTSLFENAIELKKFNLLVINFHKILGGKEVSFEDW